MRVEVVVPWQPNGCQHRQAAWDWVRGQYRDHHPDWVVTTAGEPGPWRKAVGVNAAATASTADILIVADADVWTPNLADAVSAVEMGAPWVVPHQLVHRLTENATAALIRGEIATQTCERPYVGIQGGGIVVLPRYTLLDVPMDERFTGWGQEDQSWGIALHYLHGPCVRLKSGLLHLWHPPQARQDRKTGSTESRLLHRQYLKARPDPAAIRSILEGARHDTRSSPEPHLHD